MYKKIFLVLVLIFTFSFGQVNAMTVSEIDTFLNMLVSINVIPANKLPQARAVLISLNTTNQGNIFSRDLTIGSTGDDVLQLQKFLNTDPNTYVAFTGIGSTGNETNYFGPATQSAVVKFQTKYNISPANGYVNLATRNIINYIISTRNTSNITQTTITPVTNNYTNINTSFSTTYGNASDWFNQISSQNAVNNRTFILSTTTLNYTPYVASTTRPVIVDIKINSLDNYNTNSSTSQSVVSWNTSNATNCLGHSNPIRSDWNTSIKPLSGYETITLSTTTTFSLFCNNERYNSLDTATFSITTGSSTYRISTTTIITYPTNNFTMSTSTLSYLLSSSTISTSTINSLLGSTTLSTSTLESLLGTNTQTTPLSTAATSNSTRDALLADATDIDKVQIIGEGMDCLSPLKNFNFPVFSISDKKITRYVWVMGESQLVDNMGGALVGNLLSGGGTDATFSPPYSIPVLGMILTFVVGEDERCSIYGTGKKVLKAYLTVRSESWVKEQEGGGSGSF